MVRKMGRYINTDQLEAFSFTDREGSFSDGVQWLLEYIDALPSVNTQETRKTAEWIYGEKDGADGWYCSNCGFHIPWYYDYYGLNNINFISDFHTCPHCDAKMVKYTGMDGEEDERSKSKIGCGEAKA